MSSESPTRVENHSQSDTSDARQQSNHPERRATRGQKVVVAGWFLTVAALLLGGVPPAFANHGDGGAPDTAPNPDNDDQQIESFNLTDAGKIARNNMAIQLDRSDIGVAPGDNDIHVYDGPYDNPNWWGLTTCYRYALGSTSRCDHFRIQYDTHGHDPTPDQTSEYHRWKFLGCHEGGHTGGLGHRSINGTYPDVDHNSCMDVENAYPQVGVSIYTTRQAFDGHDVGEISEDTTESSASPEDTSADPEGSGQIPDPWEYP